MDSSHEIKMEPSKLVSYMLVDSIDILEDGE